MEKENKNRSAIWIILLLASVGFNIYQWQHQSQTVAAYDKKVDTVEEEKIDIEKELTAARADIEQFKGQNATLDSLVADYEKKIDEQEKAIKQMKGNARSSKELNDKLANQLKILQGLRDEYLGRIDSLLIVNQQLQTDKQQLTSTVENLSKNLETTVSTASALKSEYITVKSYQRKGSGKYKETAMAKRTHKMDICFDVLDNKIAKAGERKIYLKITEPGGKALGDRSAGSGSFKMAGGDEVMYANSSTINYDGSKQHLCMSYEEQQDKMLPAGTYLIEVYVDGNLSGAGSCVLK